MRQVETGRVGGRARGTAARICGKLALEIGVSLAAALLVAGGTAWLRADDAMQAATVIPYQASVDPFSGKITDRLGGEADDAAPARSGRAVPVFAAAPMFRFVADSSWSTPVQPRRPQLAALETVPLRPLTPIAVPLPPDRKPAATAEAETADETADETAAGSAPEGASRKSKELREGLFGWAEPVAAALSPRQWLASGDAAIRRVGAFGGSVLARITP